MRRKSSSSMADWPASRQTIRTGSAVRLHAQATLDPVPAIDLRDLPRLSRRSGQPSEAPGLLVAKLERIMLHGVRPDVALGLNRKTRGHRQTDAFPNCSDAYVSLPTFLLRKRQSPKHSIEAIADFPRGSLRRKSHLSSAIAMSAFRKDAPHPDRAVRRQPRSSRWRP